MAVGDVYILAFNYEVDKVPCSLVLHYKETVACTSPHPANVFVVAWDATCRAVISAAQSNKVIYGSASAYRVWPTSSLPGLLTYPEGTADGDLAEEVLPANVSALFNIQTNAPSGRNNGKCYLSGATEPSLVGNDWSLGANFAALQAVGTALMTLVIDADGTWQLVVRNTSVLGVPQAPPTYSTAIGISLRLSPSGQRKRTAREQYTD